MAKKIIEKELKSDMILYDSEQDDVHMLNATARSVYTLYKEGKDITGIEKEIRGTFQLEDDLDIHEHIKKCLEELKKKGLIEY